MAKKPSTVEILATLSLEDLVDRLTDQLTDEELFTLIRDIDITVADYDFTKRLRDHFVAEIDKEESKAEDDVGTTG